MRGDTSLVKTAVLAVLVTCGGPDKRQPGGSQTGGEATPGAASAEYQPPRNLAKIDACGLLPAGEIPARFGAVIEGPTLTRDPNGLPTCSYVLAPNTGLIIELIEPYMYDINRNVWDSKRIQAVDGIGEKAFLVRLEPPSDPYLVAAKGNATVKVTTRNLELARESAKTVLAKL
jgi:hypothetical protein